jgi:uncharacterized Zn finger protein (UPF0148 family)
MSSSSIKSGRKYLNKSLATLLDFDDEEDVIDIIEHLLSFESKDDLLEHLSALLGREDDEVELVSFVDNIIRFQNGDDLDYTYYNDNGDNGGNGNGDDGRKKEEERKRMENERKLKEEEEERKQQQKQQQEKEEEQRRKIEQMKLEQQRALDRIQKEKEKEEEKLKNSKNSNNKKTKSNSNSNKVANAKGMKKATTKTTKSTKVSLPPTVTKPNKTPSLPLKGKAKIICGCYGTINKPLTNCLNCGRIICEKEGYGYCPHCGYLIEEIRIPKGDGDEEFHKAILHKERLLEFDKMSASRTKVYDSQADYYSNSTSNWLTKEEQLDAEVKEEERRNELHSRKYTLDLDI